MTRRLQRWAIMGSIAMTLLAYLFHVPNNEGVAQMTQIRMLSATMKIIKFTGQVCEWLGVSTEFLIQRQAGFLVGRMKPPSEDGGLEIEDTTIVDVPVRIYRPSASSEHETKLRPALIYYHGGAYYLGSYITHNSITSGIARLTGFIVISVSYRLAPEHPYPMGVNDCTAVTKYLLETSHAEQLGIDPNRIAIGGDSAGGNFAAVISRRLALDSAQLHRPRHQILIYPHLQWLDFTLPSYRQPGLQIFHFANMNDVLRYYFNATFSKPVRGNRHTSREQKQHYRSFVDWSLIPPQYRQIYKHPVGEDEDGDPTLVQDARSVLDPDASPLLVDNETLAKLPPTYVLTVGHDSLRDEGFIYAARVKASGVPVVHHHFENAFHGSLAFLSGPFALAIGHDLLNDVVNYLKENL